MDFELDNLIRLSNYAGLREDLVQAGGGNSSVKINSELMLIKASGYNLAEIDKNKGYTCVNYKLINERLSSNISLSEEEGKALITEVNQGKARPSIETFLHAITGKYTLHTHPAIVSMLVCRENGMDECKKLFPESMCIGYATPGVRLAHLYYLEAQKNGVSDIIFMQQHGMVISGDTVENVIEKTEYITIKLEKYFGVDFSAYHNQTELMSLFSVTGCDIDNIYYTSDKYIYNAAANGMWRYDFCPDCVVYCGKKALVLDEKNIDNIASYIQKYGKPHVIWYKGNCYIYAENFAKAKAIESVLRFSAQVSETKGKLHYLSEDEQVFLLGWEAEKYRKELKK